MEPHSIFQAVLDAQPLILDQLRQLYSSYIVGRQLALKFESPPPTSHFKFHQGLLFYKGHLFVPIIQLQKQLFLEFHSTPIGGHSGINGGHSGIKGTLARVSTAFSLPHMTRNIKTWV